MVSGIVAEYNPLHNGHVYHIQQTKKITDCDGIVCVMSGNFVQRGLPAIFDKWSRAQLALQNGVDLVLELPVVYSVSSAEFFSFGAVSLLNSLGIIDYISFGSECGDVGLLKSISKVLVDETTNFKNSLKTSLNKSNSYAKSRGEALSNELGSEYDNILNNPNNILGIEYIKSLLLLNSKIKPVTIKRFGSEYNEEKLQSGLSSASAIRNFLKNNNNILNLKNEVPETTIDMLKSFDILIEPDSMINFIKYKLITDPTGLENIPDIKEGLHNRILKFAFTEDNLTSLVLKIKSKRYAYSRINRILCQYFLNFERYDIQNLRKMPCPYARILGFNEKGAALLKLMKRASSIPLINKLPKAMSDTMKLDVEATNAYSLLNKSTKYNDDFLRSPTVYK